MSTQPIGALLSNAPLPLEDPIAQPKRPQYGKGEDPQEGHITRSWLDWFTSLTNSVSVSAQRIASVELTGQVGNLGPIDITNGDIAAGVYRFTAYGSITAAAVGGTLDLSLDWTEDGLARVDTSASIDATDTSKFGRVGGLIRVDGASPIRYTAVHPGAGGTYTLVVVLETVQT